jgi:hypothetical protein
MCRIFSPVLYHIDLVPRNGQLCRIWSHAMGNSRESGRFSGQQCYGQQWRILFCSMGNKADLVPRCGQQCKILFCAKGHIGKSGSACGPQCRRDVVGHRSAKSCSCRLPMYRTGLQLRVTAQNLVLQFILSRRPQYINNYALYRPQRGS